MQLKKRVRDCVFVFSRFKSLELPAKSISVCRRSAVAEEVVYLNNFSCGNNS